LPAKMSRIGEGILKLNPRRAGRTERAEPEARAGLTKNSAHGPSRTRRASAWETRVWTERPIVDAARMSSSISAVTFRRNRAGGAARRGATDAVESACKKRHLYRRYRRLRCTSAGGRGSTRAC